MSSEDTGSRRRPADRIGSRGDDNAADGGTRDTVLRQFEDALNDAQHRQAHRIDPEPRRPDPEPPHRLGGSSISGPRGVSVRRVAERCFTDNGSGDPSSVGAEAHAGRTVARPS